MTTHPSIAHTTTRAQTEDHARHAHTEDDSRATQSTHEVTTERTTRTTKQIAEERGTLPATRPERRAASPLEALLARVAAPVGSAVVRASVATSDEGDSVRTIHLATPDEHDPSSNTGELRRVVRTSGTSKGTSHATTEGTANGARGTR